MNQGRQQLEALINQRLEELVREVVRELVLLQELQGKTQVEAIVHMAERNNGLIKVADARQLLLNARLMSVKNSPNIFYTVLTRSGKFERVGPGEYRLLGINGKLPKDKPKEEGLEKEKRELQLR